MASPLPPFCVAFSRMLTKTDCSRGRFSCKTRTTRTTQTTSGGSLLPFFCFSRMISAAFSFSRANSAPLMVFLDFCRIREVRRFETPRHSFMYDLSQRYGFVTAARIVLQGKNFSVPPWPVFPGSSCARFPSGYHESCWRIVFFFFFLFSF